MKKLIRNKLKSLFKESLGFPNILPLPKEACREEEKLKGGLADGKTLKDIAKDHKVSLSDITAQVAKGKDVESEHSKDPDEQIEIAKDHVEERPDYYDALDAAGIEEEKLNEAPWFTDTEPSFDLAIELFSPHSQEEQKQKFEEFKQHLITIFSGELKNNEKQNAGILPKDQAEKVKLEMLSLETVAARLLCVEFFKSFGGVLDPPHPDKFTSKKIAIGNVNIDQFKQFINDCASIGIPKNKI